MLDLAQPGLDYCLVLAACPYEDSLAGGTPFKIMIGEKGKHSQ